RRVRATGGRVAGVERARLVVLAGHRVSDARAVDAAAVVADRAQAPVVAGVRARPRDAARRPHARAGEAGAVGDGRCPRHADVADAVAVIAHRALIAVLARGGGRPHDAAVLRIALAGEALPAAVERCAAARAVRLTGLVRGAHAVVVARRA